MKSDYNTYNSYITQEKLAQYYGTKDVDGIRAYLDKMNTSGLVRKIKNKQRGQYGSFIKYTYHINIEDFFFVSERLHYEPVKRELKGFLLLFRCLCFGTTLTCHYKQKQIAELMALDEATVSRYIRKSIELGYIEKDEKCKSFSLIRQDIFIPQQRTEEDVSKIISAKAYKRHREKKKELMPHLYFPI